jgi:4-amino-4-deoxychorismate lyase
MNDFETVFYYKTSDGEWQDKPLPFHHRGALFADGLFETMVFTGGKIRFAAQHFDRLMEGCFQLGFDASMVSSIAVIEDFINNELRVNVPVRIRWNIFRAGIGKYTPENNEVIESMILQTFYPAPKIKKSAYISTRIQVPASPWSHCKTINALHYVMANKERDLLKQDEVLLTDAHGSMAEAGAANLFWKQNDVYYTPSLSASCIAGVARKNILTTLVSAGVMVEEGLFSKEQLLHAQQVFVCNATGISYIAEIEGRNFSTIPDPLLDSLFGSE